MQGGKDFVGSYRSYSGVGSRVESDSKEMVEEAEEEEEAITRRGKSSSVLLLMAEGRRRLEESDRG
jgi:hypothetical protein